MNSNSKIYVAGHTGLVGSMITETLKKKGYTNLVFCTLEELDLRNQKDTDDFFAKEKPEAVILCAAKVGGIMANNTLRAEFIYENLMIEANVIHSSWKYGVKKLVFLGSSCIYPRDAPQPLKEDYLLASPLEYTNEPYAIAKIAGLKMCESYNLRYGTDFIAVMPTNLYGPNDNFNLIGGHVLPALTRRIHLGKLLEDGNIDGIREDLKTRNVDGINGNESEKDLINLLKKHGVKYVSGKDGQKIEKGNVSVTVWGTGKPLREFMWSGDMADATIFIMEKISFKDLISDNDEIRNTHINIGTGEEITINDLAFMLKEVIGFKGVIDFDKSKPDGTPRKLIDSTKLHNLGFRHKTSIKEGTSQLYKWYLNSLQ